MLAWIEEMSLDWAPHGYCLAWDYRIIAVDTISDAMIFLSYATLAAGLFLAKWMGCVDKIIRPDNVWMWACFIFACGDTHLLKIFSIWQPIYAMAAFTKFLTAVVSTTAAVETVITLLNVWKSKKETSRA